MAKALLELIARKLPGKVLESHSQHGDETVVVAPQDWYEVHAFLKDEPLADMQMLVDLTAVDFPKRLPRFEVVTHLLSLRLGHRIRVKARIGDADGEDAVIDTITPLWASANWAERECFDTMGIRFAGHPDLRRILLYPEFVGHPLRKDYPAELTQPLVPYRDAENIEKLPPFNPYEGMPFGRKTHHLPRVTDPNGIQERD
jgi:NADH-quinone oxidoreductase subunit C